MKTVLTARIAAVLCLGAWHSTAWADGGTLRVAQPRGDYQISVFTAPNPLRAGPIDVSVLVLDLKTSEPASNCQTMVTLTPADRHNTPIHAPATTGAATNKLLQSAKIELPASGTWHVRVASTAGGEDIETQFTMWVDPPLPRWLAEWPWFTWPAVAVLLFVTHRMLAARRAQHGPRASVPGDAHSARLVTGTNFCARSP